MFEKLINLIFGCNHPERHHSALPFTQDGKSYRVCLNCGTPIEFSLEDFQYITRGYLRRKRRQAARLNSSESLERYAGKKRVTPATARQTG